MPTTVQNARFGLLLVLHRLKAKHYEKGIVYR